MILEVQGPVQDTLRASFRYGDGVHVAPSRASGQVRGPSDHGPLHLLTCRILTRKDSGSSRTLRTLGGQWLMRSNCTFALGTLLLNPGPEGSRVQTPLSIAGGGPGA